jgi:hypothetical protein
VDPTTLLILGGIAVAVVVAALFVLNRSWGNFPDQAGRLPGAGPSAPGISGSSNISWGGPEPESTIFEPTEVPQPAAAQPAGGLVPIEHPMVRHAAEEALKKDSRAARYIVRDGDRLYFSFDQISDPAQRQAAYDMMRRFNAGEETDLKAMLKLAQLLFK